MTLDEIIDGYKADAVELREAAKAVLDCFDRGEFVRNTDHDGGSEWAIRAVRPLAALAKLKQLVND